MKRVFGTKDNDIFNFRAFDDDVNIFGKAGNDRFEGPENFTSTIFGGSGDDSFWGGNLSDYFSGGSGNDFMGGGPGDDILVGNKGDDEIYGGDGDDRINGGPGTDLINAGGGVNKVKGGYGENIFYIDAWDNGYTKVTDFVSRKDFFVYISKYNQPTPDIEYDKETGKIYAIYDDSLERPDPFAKITPGSQFDSGDIIII